MSIQKRTEIKKQVLFLVAVVGNAISSPRTKHGFIRLTEQGSSANEGGDHKSPAYLDLVITGSLMAVLIV